MFTGIVTDVGTIDSVTPLKEGIKLRVATNYDPKTIDMGASIAHSGVCLTVTVIAALAAFDIVYVSTGGGPGGATAVPGIQIYILAFLERG